MGNIETFAGIRQATFQLLGGLAYAVRSSAVSGQMLQLQGLNFPPQRTVYGGHEALGHL